MCECWWINVEKIMATAEQVQEALQQLQAQEARIAALETQLRVEQTRSMTAEQERSTLIQTLGAMRMDRGGAMVDTKGIGQPFMLKGTADQDFGERTHKVRTFMLARVGDQILTALTWSSTTAEDRCQDLRSFAERPLCSLVHCLWRTGRRRRTDRQH